jgi:dolichol-phosphate mannosyltransferase
MLDFRRIFQPEAWTQFVKFNLVGLSGVLVNEGVLLLFVSAGMYYLYASVVAIELSIISNFLLNDYWTFRERRHGHIAVRMLKFNALMIVGLLVNLLILYAGTELAGINYAVSNLVGIAGAFVVRYWLSVKYAWIKKEEQSVKP